MLDRLPPEYRRVLEPIRRAASVVESPDEGLQDVVDTLARAFEHYTWVGIYLVRDETLALGPWRGPAPTEHTHFPIGVGICGVAAAIRRTEVVPDVSQDPRYRECFAWTRSKIVVPIVHQDDVYGVIDVDSDRLNAFAIEDVLLLEHVSRLIVPLGRAAVEERLP